MDELARFNKERWEAIAAANFIYTRPLLDLTPESARRLIDPYGLTGEVAGKRVLCLASGGGQQSAAFAVLGADVTVLDLSETQLERDRVALTHYGREGRLVQGDMRDLSAFESASFDIVWHSYSINFVPDVAPVFDGVRRVIRPGGLYRLRWQNPFVMGMDETTWNGEGYLMKRRYADGEVRFDTDFWDVEDVDGTVRKVEGPREFNHTLSTVMNGLIRRGFNILGLWEDLVNPADAAPGTWDHFRSIAPTELMLYTRAS
jgi:SAM-dependent methyltransferase